jgi:hypothetical protein
MSSAGASRDTRHVRADAEPVNQHVHGDQPRNLVFIEAAAREDPT